MIQLYNLSKTYPNGVVALSDVNLHIRKGEFVFLVGPSGAGKSSLMKLVIRQELPTSGQILVGGRNVSRLRASEVPYLRRRVGFVFQDFKLLPDKTVRENVAFALEVTEAPTREAKRRVPAVLELVGLADKADVYPHELSGGQQQRVSVARAIINNPLVLLADEPTGNLDPETSFGIMELLAEINRRGTTVVMATHNREIVDRMRRRVVAIENGQIVRDEEGGTYASEA
ncbi:MAG TPA: cell division ATP-binding protein FtsE [Firmicutes bacterium]|nr:cell division ATP-binding protein FtsE [Bacillota bacterium]